MRKLAIFGAVVCLAAYLGSGVWPESTVSQETRPPAVGNQILTIPACAFNEAEDGYNFKRDDVLYFPLPAQGIFYAPVNLPEGAKIQKIILECQDYHPHGDIKMSLMRFPAGASLADVSSSGQDSNPRRFTQKLTLNKWVNPWRYSYYFKLHLPGASPGYYFVKAMIVYTPPSP